MIWTPLIAQTKELLTSRRKAFELFPDLGQPGFFQWTTGEVEKDKSLIAAKKKLDPITRLDLAASSGDNALLFSKHLDKEVSGLSYPLTAQALCVASQFTCGAGGGFTHSMAFGRVCATVISGDLRRNLWLNLPAQGGTPASREHWCGPAMWEMDGLPSGSAQVLLDGYSWTPSMIRLQPPLPGEPVRYLAFIKFQEALAIIGRPAVNSDIKEVIRKVVSKEDGSSKTQELFNDPLSRSGWGSLSKPDALPSDIWRGMHETLRSFREKEAFSLSDLISDRKGEAENLHLDLTMMTAKNPPLRVNRHAVIPLGQFFEEDDDFEQFTDAMEATLAAVKPILDNARKYKSTDKSPLSASNALDSMLWARLEPLLRGLLWKAAQGTLDFAEQEHACKEARQIAQSCLQQVLANGLGQLNVNQWGLLLSPMKKKEAKTKLEV